MPEIFASRAFRIEPGEIWPAIYEKSYAKLRSGNLTDKPDILTLHGGDCVDASVKLVPGLAATYISNSSTTADELWSTLQANSHAQPVLPGPPAITLVRAGWAVNPLTDLDLRECQRRAGSHRL